MLQGSVMTEEQVKLQPYHKAENEAEKEAPRPKLTLKYLHDLIEKLQEDQRNLSMRVDELHRLLTCGDGHGMPHQSAEWAIAPLPAAAAAEGRLKDRSDPASMESILQELKEAARIADEIAEHAAAVHAQDSLRREEAEKQPSSPASEIFEPVPRLPQYASDAPILISRAERHHRHKRSFWSRLFGR